MKNLLRLAMLLTMLTIPLAYTAAPASEGKEEMIQDVEMQKEIELPELSNTALKGLTPYQIADRVHKLLMQGYTVDDIKPLIKALTPAEINAFGPSSLLNQVIQNDMDDNPDIVGLFLAAEADPDLQDSLGNTALYTAAQRNKPRIVNLLLNNRYRRADTTIRNGLGNTPLHVAAIFGFDKIVTLLLAAKADPNARHKQYGYSSGDTPLHNAVQNNKRMIVTLLLDDPRTDVSRVNSAGETAEQIAIRNNNQPIINLFNRQEAMTSKGSSSSSAQ